MNQKNLRENWLNSVTFRYPTPLGTAWIIIMEESPGKIYKVTLSVGKAGNSINAMCASTAALVTRLLHEGKGINDVIMELNGITSDKLVKHKGIDIHSPIDALILALAQYNASVQPTRDKLKFK